MSANQKLKLAFVLALTVYGAVVLWAGCSKVSFATGFGALGLLNFITFVIALSALLLKK